MNIMEFVENLLDFYFFDNFCTCYPFVEIDFTFKHTKIAVKLHLIVTFMINTRMPIV